LFIPLGLPFAFQVLVNILRFLRKAQDRPERVPYIGAEIPNDDRPSRLPLQPGDVIPVVAMRASA